MTTAPIAALRQINGKRYCHHAGRRKHRFLKGFRTAGGDAAAVVCPGTLVQFWDTLTVCIDAGCAVIVQAQNTGLTGGSTPARHGYARPVVVINILRISGLRLIEEGKQVIALPGTTLADLEAALAPCGREPHSLIGSSCLGATAIGGLCNNSGGSLVNRGPAYTEMALYAQLDAAGSLRLVNHLGIDLGENPRRMLERLDRNQWDDCDVAPAGARQCSDGQYAHHVRDFGSPVPARYNADPRRLFEASGSAGRVAVFAARFDTFPQPQAPRIFHFASNDPCHLTALRHRLLDRGQALPIAAEYLHRDAWLTAERFGKDLFLAVRHLGPRRLPGLFAAKRRLEHMSDRIGQGDALERVVQWCSDRMPNQLPQDLRQAGHDYEHHLLVKVEADALPGLEADAAASVKPCENVRKVVLSDTAGDLALTHRFVAAGAAIRLAHCHRSAGPLVAVDVALPRNAEDWHMDLPSECAAMVYRAVRYGHFLCHVFHWDYVLHRGADAARFKTQLLAHLDARGAEYPAEHNVGHQYLAKPELAAFYERLDPCHRLNPGIGLPSGIVR